MREKQEVLKTMREKQEVLKMMREKQEVLKTPRVRKKKKRKRQKFSHYTPPPSHTNITDHAPHLYSASFSSLATPPMPSPPLLLPLPPSLSNRIALIMAYSPRLFKASRFVACKICPIKQLITDKNPLPNNYTLFPSVGELHPFLDLRISSNPLHTILIFYLHKQFLKPNPCSRRKNDDSTAHILPQIMAPIYPFYSSFMNFSPIAMITFLSTA